jgi:PQQ-like domain
MRNGKLLRANVLALGLASAGTASATNWLQFGYDQAHSGNNTAENGYTTATGNTVLYHASLSTVANSAPVFLGNVSTPSGTKDMLFVTAKNGTLLALDASDGSTLWHQPSNPSGGPTAGAPAIDPSLQFVYAYELDGKIHKYQVGDGTEITTDNWPQTSTMKPGVEKGAGSLSIASPAGAGGVNYLYAVTDGYIGDAGDYQGHVTAINLSAGTQVVFNTLCSDQGNVHFDQTGSSATDCANHQSGIWGRPGTVFDASTNRIYMATGNFGASIDGKNWGESVFTLPAAFSAAQTAPTDSYTPSEYASMGDSDLGSSSPALLPEAPTSKYPHMAVQVGKDSQVRLLNLDNLSNTVAGPSPGHLGGEIQKQALPQGGVVLPQAAVWVNPADGSTWVFIVNGSGATAYKLSIDGSGNPTLAKQWPTTGHGMAGTSPVIANSTLYYVSSGAVNALNPTTGAVIWSDSSIGDINWQSPILVNGHLYVIDNSSKLWVYALDGVFKNGFE